MKGISIAKFTLGKKIKKGSVSMIWKCYASRPLKLEQTTPSQDQIWDMALKL